MPPIVREVYAEIMGVNPQFGWKGAAFAGAALLLEKSRMYWREKFGQESIRHTGEIALSHEVYQEDAA